MKNSIGKPYEGIENHERKIKSNLLRIKFHVRFDEGGADSLHLIITFMVNSLGKLSGSTLPNKPKKEATVDILQLVNKGKMQQPSHKTAHLQAPTYKPMLLLTKELFFSNALAVI